jgi:dihydroorotase
MAGAETLLAMVLTLVRDGVIGLERAFDLVARNPAQLLGVDARRTARRRRGRRRDGRSREAVGGRFGQDGGERRQHPFDRQPAQVAWSACGRAGSRSGDKARRSARVRPQAARSSAIAEGANGPLVDILTG